MIIAPKDLDFVPAIHQIQPIPLFNYQRPRPTYISPIFEVPPSNLPRYLQFYKVRNDFFQGIL